MKIQYVVLALLLASCSGTEVKESLGLTRESPDEFKVVSRPPLSVPPEFNLRPPMPGEAAMADQTRTQAKQLVLGEDGMTLTLEEKSAAAPAETAVTPVVVESAKSSADAAFLQQAGVAAADPNIRETLYQENENGPNKQKSLLEKLTVLPDAQEPVVDAKGEAERIRTTKDEGKPITEGETPEKETKEKGVLGNFF